MRKLLLLSLIIFSSCASHVWAVSQEQYDKYYIAKMNGNFGEIMEVVNHIIATKDPSKLTIDDFEILATGLGYTNEFGYVPSSIEEVDAFSKFFKIQGSSNDYRTIDMLWLAWSTSVLEDSSASFHTLLDWDAFRMTDVEGGMSPSVYKLVNWKLTKNYVENAQFVDAEMSLLNSLKIGQGNLVYPWDAALGLSRLSYLYQTTGQSDLAIATAINADKILRILPAVPHLYLGEIVTNMVSVAVMHGYFEDADVYIGLLKLQENQQHKYKNNESDLFLATMESYMAFRTLDADRLQAARTRHKNSGWMFTKLDEDFYYDYVENYIKVVNSNDCSLGDEFNSDDIQALQQKNIGNILHILELNKTSLCGDFKKTTSTLENLTLQAQETVRASYQGLARSLETSPHTIWTEEMLLKSLLRFQAAHGSLDEHLIDEAIELFLSIESSPAVRELKTLALAKASKSPTKINKLRTYFNLLREREIWLAKLLDVYTNRVLIWAEAGAPLDKDFDPTISASERKLVDARLIIEDFLKPSAADSSMDIVDNLLPHQAAIFNIDGSNLQLSCLVSRQVKHCEVVQKSSKYQTATRRIIRAITGRNLAATKPDIEYVSSIKFSPKIRELAQDYKEIFYVPTADDWNLPMNLIWSASNIPSSLIISPTLSGLTHKDPIDDGNQAKYSYTGIGNPNYGVKSLAALTNLEQINGFSLRSAEYISEISQLTQLPSTEVEIQESERNFKGDTQIILGVNANEDHLLDIDWYDADIIHFATHALISGEMKGVEEPAIALSNPDANSYQDGLLTATDIRGYNFPNSTIILSGCRTATDYGKSSKKGVTGLSLAFLLQGAKNLVVTQWQIPDEFSAQIMGEVTKNLSTNSSASSLSQVLNAYSSEDIDPFNWAAYIFISIPSRYNQTKVFKKEKTSVGILANLDVEKSPLTSEMTQKTINGKQYIGLSGTQRGKDQKTFTIYKTKNGKFDLISEMEGVDALFIGPDNEKFLFMISLEGAWIGRLNDSLTAIEEKIPLVNASNITVTNFAYPTHTDNGFIFAYRGENLGAKDAFVKLVEIDFQLSQRQEWDITQEIFSVKSPKNYVSDGSWFILQNEENIHIAISRNFTEPNYDKTSREWDFPQKQHTHFYEFNKAKKLINTNYLEFSRLLGILDKPTKHFAAAITADDRLALVSLSGNIIKSNKDITSVATVRPIKTKNRDLLSVTTGEVYSNQSYSNIFQASMTLTPAGTQAPIKTDETLSWPDRVIKTYKEGLDKTGLTRALFAEKWIYQNLIVDLNTSNLDVESIYKSGPTVRTPLGFIHDKNTKLRVDMVNMNRLEYEYSEF